MTDTELNALVARIADGIDNDASWPLDGKRRRDAADALDALVAEVERLREEAHTMRLWAEEAARAENLNAEDAKRERAAVVTFLRAHADLRSSHHHVEVVQEAADMVERGEHMWEDA